MTVTHPEDVPRAKTRSSFAFQNREAKFSSKTILLRPGLYEMKVEKTLKFFQSFGRLQLFGLWFVFPKFQSFGRPPVLAIPALTVLILTMQTLANGPGTHLQRSSTAKRKIVSQGDSANAAAVSI
jgi:hypothetical protein